MTMGMVEVACLAASRPGYARDDHVHREANQLGGEVREPFVSPSAHRYSMTMFAPSS